MTPDERARAVMAKLNRIWLISDRELIATAIKDAEQATEDRCYAASEELCAKIAEMHDEIERLRSLKTESRG